MSVFSDGRIGIRVVRALGLALAIGGMSASGIAALGGSPGRAVFAMALAAWGWFLHRRLGVIDEVTENAFVVSVRRKMFTVSRRDVRAAYRLNLYYPWREYLVLFLLFPADGRSRVYLLLNLRGHDLAGLLARWGTPLKWSSDVELGLRGRG